MKRNQTNRKATVWNSVIILLSIAGLIVCIAILFPQARQMIINMINRALGRELSMYQSWSKFLMSLAMGGVFLILSFDYCTLTESGRALVKNVKQEIKDCLSEIDFRSFRKPVLLLSAIYLLGIITIIRANFSYLDDIGRAVNGSRGWYNWSRYISEFFSIVIHADTNLTDISPLPQLLAVLMLSISSVFLVYVVSNKKITVIRLLASIPVGLSPFFLECISFKFDSPYMALSVLASIFPFLFVARKKAFAFVSVISLLIVCMTYQATSGIYIMLVIMLGFQNWNRVEKTNKEILSFTGAAAFAFCFAMLFFKFFLMRTFDEQQSTYISNAMYPVAHIISGTLDNVKNYILTIYSDFGVIWKAGTALILVFFVIQSMSKSVHKKISSFFISIAVLFLSFILLYGIYLLLAVPIYSPRALTGFGVFLAVISIYIVSNLKQIATITVIALNWCFFTFAFSYGNALTDQGRYIEFRRGMILNDLNVLYSNEQKKVMTFQIKNTIDFAPTVKNIAKHNPVIEQLVPKGYEKYRFWEYLYFPDYIQMDFESDQLSNKNCLDYDTLNLPVVLDSYYHTIRSDGSRVLIILKH